jgi:hypothetical protein
MGTVRKTILLGLISLLFSTVGNGWAQIISIGYIDGNNIGDIEPTPIYYWTGQGTRDLAPVEGTFVQVLARPGGTIADFKILSSTVGVSTFGLVALGYFSAGILQIPSVTGSVGSQQPVDFIIRAWHGADNWESAQITPGALAGKTPVFQETVQLYERPIDVIVTENLAHASSFTLVPIPEPSAIILGVLGTVMILLIRRASSSHPRRS